MRIGEWKKFGNRLNGISNRFAFQKRPAVRNGVHSRSVETDAPIVIIGSGPAGARAAQELVQHGHGGSILVFGDERWDPYNRVLLTPLLAGEIDLSEVYFPFPLTDLGQNIRWIKRRIVSIDRDREEVVDIAGKRYRFSKLILAMGSRPHVPQIPNIDMPGVFTFRDLNDAEKLMARSFRSRKAVVIGGGLLGLEAARGLHRRGVETTVVDHELWLLARQLDKDGGTLLAEQIRGLKIDVRLGSGVKEIIFEREIRGVLLMNEETVECDTVVVCTGIRPNSELALEAGISVGRGIRVNDNMQTSDPNVYAIGECAEHRERVYGLVAPGLEQAGVAVHHILGGKANYTGSVAATKLKVIDVPVFSMGPVSREDEEQPHFRLRSVHYKLSQEGVYRRLIRDRGRLVGVVSVGSWPELNRVQESVSRRRWLMPWNQWRFRKTGCLWREGKAAHVRDWPASAVVCNCTGVTQGTLATCINSENCSLEDLQKKNGCVDGLRILPAVVVRYARGTGRRHCSRWVEDPRGGLCGGAHHDADHLRGFSHSIRRKCSGGVFNRHSLAEFPLQADFRFCAGWFELDRAAHVFAQKMGPVQSGEF